MDVAAAHRPHLARWARSRTVARVCGSQAAFTLNQSFQIIFLQQGRRHGAARRRSRQRGGNQHCLETARWAADPKPTCSGEQKTLTSLTTETPSLLFRGTACCTSAGPPGRTPATTSARESTLAAPPSSRCWVSSNIADHSFSVCGQPGHR